MDPLQVASSTVPFILKQLASPAIREIAKIWNVEKEHGELVATYGILINKLGLWDGRWEVDGVTLEPWLQELEGYLYDTEDLVDHLLLSSRTNGENWVKNQIGRLIKSTFSYINPLTTPHKIVKLREDLEGLNSRIGRVWEAGQTNPNQLPPYKSLLSDSIPFVSGTGRDQDKDTIIKKLTSMMGDRSGVSIVGCGGIGKTSLARTILVDETIKSHFPLILSASVSGDFRMTDVVHKLVANYLEKNPRAAPESYQGESILLRDLLPKRRALIILDDLWSVNGDDWQCFESNYLNSCRDVKILITTPNPNVAKVTKSVAYEVDSMSDRDCTKLIMEIGKALEFERDIEIIAKKCEGLPIIANKLGLELSKIEKVDEKKDKIVLLKNCNLLDLREFRALFRSLNLHYFKMPFHRRRCFAYFSLFPADHGFNKHDLIQLWEAEGFIQPQETTQLQGTRYLKLAAQNECFDDMLSTSILHPFKHSEKPVYKMQGSKYRFAHLLASKAICRIDEGTSNSLVSCQNIRHLSLASCQNIDEALLKKMKECTGLRTLLLLHRNKPQTLSIPHVLIDKLRRLRLLDLSHTNISTLSKTKPLTKHLRYLDLSSTNVAKLPELIQCRALQVLKLNDCADLLQLPNLNKLISLTHLHFSPGNLTYFPSEMRKLTNLEVLDSFSVRKRDGCKVSELSSMTNLTEILITGLENIKDEREAKEAKLSEKPCLKKVELEWKNDEAMNAERVLEGLKPHNDLDVLKVRNYGGKIFPAWLTSPTFKLQSIYFENFSNCQALPSLGQLPTLMNLVLQSIEKVTILDNQFCGNGEIVFPCLEFLEIRGMKNLANWTGLKSGSMPMLRALNIIDCPVLHKLPSFMHLSSLVDLEINDCPKLQSLPDVPSSSNGMLAKLIIKKSDFLKEGCQDGEADWAKIKGIPYVEIDGIRIPTATDKKGESKTTIKATSVVSAAVCFVTLFLRTYVWRSWNCPAELPAVGDENFN